MFGLFKKRDNKIKNKNIKIIYENGIVREEINSWIKSFGIINIFDLFFKLGFKNDDIVYLYQDYSGLYRVLYSINEDRMIYNNVIKFDYKNRELIVSSGNESRCYKIINNDNRDVELDLFYYKRKISDRVTCFHKIGGNNFLFIVDNGNYELTLEFYTECKICKDELDDLENYLINLEFPIIVEDVYTEIGNILSLEQGMMDLFNLVVTKNIDKRQPDIILDEILIQNGVFERITKTCGNRSITLNKVGNWSYNKIDNDMVFIFRYQEDNDFKYRYVYRDNSENKDGCFREEAYEIMDEARNEVVKVRRLVREMFPRK